MKIKFDVSKPDDELLDLIQQKSSDSENAWKVLINRHHRVIANLAWKFSPDDPSRQEDLCQRAWMKAFEKVDNFEGRSKFSTWLYQLSRNTFIDLARSKAWETPEEFDENTVPTEGPNANELCMLEAWLFFKRKNKVCFEVLQLYYRGGYTWKEVGEQLGKSATAAKEQGNSCLKKFKPIAMEMCGDV